MWNTIDERYYSFVFHIETKPHFLMFASFQSVFTMAVWNTIDDGSMTGILEELKWKTLQKRRKDNRLILLYKGLKGKARIPTDGLIPKNRRCRNQHSLVFQIPTASIDAYLKSFFPQTIRNWNVLPDSLISSAELSDDCVSKFTSLVTARD